MADIYFEAGTGTGGSGTSGDPYESLQTADDNASNGDTLILKNGTYTLTSNVSTTLSTSVTVTSESNDASLAIIDGDNRAYGYKVAMDGNDITISNITFFEVYGNTAFLSPGNSRTGLVIEKCVLEDCQGIAGRGWIGADSGTNCELTVRNNVFKSIIDKTQYGIIGFHGPQGFTANIYNNVYYDKNASAVNAFVSDWAGAYGTYNIKNNIIYGDNGVSKTLVGANASSDVTFTHNCYYANSGSWVLSGVDTNTDNITDNPLFVDLANDDFRLQSNSPCIDTGTIL